MSDIFLTFNEFDRIKHYLKRLYFMYDAETDFSQVCLARCSKYPVVSLPLIYSPYDLVLDKNYKAHIIQVKGNSLYDYIVGEGESVIDDSYSKYGYIGLIAEQDKNGNIILVDIRRKPYSGGKVVVEHRVFDGSNWSEPIEWTDEFFYNGYLQYRDVLYVKPSFEYVFDYDEYEYKIQENSTATWTANTSIQSRARYVKPTGLSNLNLRFWDKQGGTTGSSEPAWNIHIIPYHDKAYLYSEWEDRIYGYSCFTKDNDVLWQLFQDELRLWQSQTQYRIGEVIKLSSGKLIRVVDMKINKAFDEPAWNIGKNQTTEDTNGNIWLYMDLPDRQSNTEYIVGNIVKVTVGSNEAMYECYQEGTSGDDITLFNGFPNLVVDGTVKWVKRTRYDYSDIPLNSTYPTYIRGAGDYVFKCIGAKSGTDEPSGAGLEDDGSLQVLGYLPNDDAIVEFSINGDNKDIVKLEDYVKSSFAISDGQLWVKSGTTELNYGNIPANSWTEEYFELSPALNWIGSYGRLRYELTISFPSGGELWISPIYSSDDYIYPSNYGLKLAINDSYKGLHYPDMEYNEDIYGDEDLTNFVFSNGYIDMKDLDQVVSFKGLGPKFYLLYEDSSLSPKLARFNENMVHDYDIILPSDIAGKNIEYKDLRLGDYVYILDFVHYSLNWWEYYQGKTRVQKRELDNGDLISVQDIWEATSSPYKYGIHLIVLEDGKYSIVYYDGDGYYVNCELVRRSFFPFFIRLCLLNTINTGLRER